MEQLGAVTAFVGRVEGLARFQVIQEDADRLTVNAVVRVVNQ